MKLPFDRERMHERNLLDDIDEIAMAIKRTPAERLVAALNLGDFCLSMARERRRTGSIDRQESLEEKARLWSGPLRVLAR
jgi:hypothetical protein